MSTNLYLTTTFTFVMFQGLKKIKSTRVINHFLLINYSSAKTDSIKLINHSLIKTTMSKHYIKIGLHFIKQCSPFPMFITLTKIIPLLSFPLSQKVQHYTIESNSLILPI